MIPPAFVNWSQLKGLVIFVRNHDELRLLGRTVPDGTAVLADDIRYGLRLAGDNVSTSWSRSSTASPGTPAVTCVWAAGRPIRLTSPPAMLSPTTG